MTTAQRRRPFDPTRDARRFVYLLDEAAGRLLEVVGVRGMGGDFPRPDAAVKVLDVARGLPEDPFEALDRAEWVPIEEAAVLAVVEPMPDDG